MLQRATLELGPASATAVSIAVNVRKLWSFIKCVMKKKLWNFIQVCDVFKALLSSDILPSCWCLVNFL